MGVCKYSKHPFIPHAGWYNSHHLHSISIADTKLAVLPREFTWVWGNQQKLCSWSLKKSWVFLLKCACCLFFTFQMSQRRTIWVPITRALFIPHNYGSVGVHIDLDCINGFRNSYPFSPSWKKSRAEAVFFLVVYGYEKKEKYKNLREQISWRLIWEWQLQTYQRIQNANFG